jgi:transposase-like protein
MQEGQLLMNQRDRDRLEILKEVKKKHTKQAEAAQELKISVRQLQRLLKAHAERGDRAVIHALRGKPSNRKIEGKLEQRAKEILSREEYRGFGPTLASEYLANKHALTVSRETVRKWMRQAGLWRGRKRRLEEVHLWRARRSRFGEMVQWDTSEHDWLEGRGGGHKLYLIAMIDDATSRALARFVENDSTAANMELLELWLRTQGRPQSFYTDKAGLFQTALKTKRDEQREGKDREPLPPTQIGRALRELGIRWIGAHSPQAKGRIERFFGTAQDRLIKDLRHAQVKTLAQANTYLEEQYLPWWNQRKTVVPASEQDAHRGLEKQHDLGAILSHVESRQVNQDYTVRYERHLYRLERADITTGLRGAMVRVEKRRDGTLAIRFQNRYLRYRLCEPAVPAMPPIAPPTPSRKGPNAGGKSDWMKRFRIRGCSLEEAIAMSNATS